MRKSSCKLLNSVNDVMPDSENQERKNATNEQLLPPIYFDKNTS